MQFKKNPRDPQFGDPIDQYEEADQSEVESLEMRPEPAPRVRPRAEADLDGSARPASRAESLIDKHSSCDGKYETGQDLRIQGTVSGEIACGGLLTIEQGAVARARIEARDAIVRGSVDGDLACSGRLLLTSTAVVTGTLKAATLVVEEGARLSVTVETSVPVAAAPPVANETPAEPIPAPEAPPAADVSIGSTRGPSWSGERRPNAGAAADSGASRGSRQAPSFAFVPTTEERAATAERN
jgi:cytoskeletal protein CcmA (bactofilin family)